MMHTSKSQVDKKHRSTLKKTQTTDIVEILLEDHKPLKVLIKMMKDSKLKFKEKRDVFEEFAQTLMVHSKSEEETLYTALKKMDALREAGYEGDVEHRLADHLINEIKNTEDEVLCAARIKVLAELVEHHLKEEEEELLPDFKKNSESHEREILGDRFLQIKVNYLANGNGISSFIQKLMS